MLDETQKIGVGLTAFGVIFTLFGVFMFFDTGLLAIGNILFLCGVVLVIGMGKTYSFFFQTRKIRGTACFLGGIIMVFMKWPVIGMLVEGFGFINLFGDFFPVVIGFLRRLPVVGHLLNMPGIAQVVDKLTGARLPV